MERVVLTLTVLATITALPLVQCTADDPMKVIHWFDAVLPLAKDKTTHLHFYLHDIVSGKNPTAIKIAQSPTSDKSPTRFGIVDMIDDVLTVGPDPSSKPVGRAQGIYGYVGKDSFSLLMNMNFVFTSKEYNGSTLSVLGNNPVLETFQEMPITGGKGAFRLARGIVKSKTYSLNITSGYAIVEYSIMVLHY